jgi:hypothetical protein
VNDGSPGLKKNFAGDWSNGPAACISPANFPEMVTDRYRPVWLIAGILKQSRGGFARNCIERMVRFSESAVRLEF